MSTPISKEDFDRIAAEIHSDKSPVGIDAKKTHIMILHKLEEISQRLEALEQRDAPSRIFNPKRD